MAVAQGRGTACPATFVFALVAALCCCTASATVWTVGNSSTNGWNIGINYTIWVSGKTFRQGDVLFFPYLKATHDVVVVNKTEYDTCTSSTANTMYSDGNTNITLKTGNQYYLCSIPTHCTLGMRLAVNVVAATSPTPAPAPAPSSPSPSPSPAPGSAPTQAPASSPTNGSTPSPASTATPASTTTPSSGPSPPTASSPPGSSSSPPAPTPSSAPCLHAAAGGVAAVLSILLGFTLLL